MSWQALNWAWKQKTGSQTRKSVLLALANAADETGEVTARQKEIAKGLEMTDRTVRSAIAGLVKKRFLVVERRRWEDTQRQRPNLYRLALTETAPESDDTPEERASLGPEESDDKSGGKEIPPKELKNQDLPSKDLEPTSPAPQDEFDEFWKSYPRRNSKRLYRGKAEKVWGRLKPDERERALTGAEHYASACDQGFTIAADAFRWLRDRAFEDWQTPAKAEPKKTPTEMGRGPIGTFNGAEPDPSCEHATPMCTECRRQNLIRLKEMAGAVKGP